MNSKHGMRFNMRYNKRLVNAMHKVRKSTGEGGVIGIEITHQCHHRHTPEVSLAQKMSMILGSETDEACME